MECRGFQKRLKGGSLGQFPRWNRFLVALCLLVEGEQYKRGGRQLLFEKAAPGSSACRSWADFFFLAVSSYLLVQ